MSVNTILRCAIAVAVAAPMYAHAESFNAKAGAWEMTTTSTTEGVLIPADVLANMKPEQRAKIEQHMKERAGKPMTHVKKVCVTQKKLDEDAMITYDNDHGHCTQKALSKSASKLVVERTCTAPRAYTAKWTVEAPTPENLEATSDV